MNAMIWHMNDLLVFYDADCSLCCKSSEKLAKADKNHSIQLVPLQTPDLISTYPQLNNHKLKTVLHVIRPDNQVFAGARAFREIGNHIQPETFWGYALKVYSFVVVFPGAIDIAEWVYRKISENRYRLSFKTLNCQDQACQR